MSSWLSSQTQFRWYDGQNIRPYVYVRSDSRVQNPGGRFNLDWFPFEPLIRNPLAMDEVGFADHILALESAAFEKSGMAMPRWVFFDCAIMPGFVAGFAQRTATLSPQARAVYKGLEEREWTPISLFIIIPAMAKGEWVAHNLCSINSLLPKEERFYGLGFLSKAFGLWYANIETCCGMTQWGSPAIRLHSHYGLFEVLTAYTPVHSYARTLTYRCEVNPQFWYSFFNPGVMDHLGDAFEPAGFLVDPKSDESIRNFQREIEKNQGSFYLNPEEIRLKPLDAPLTVFRKR